MDGCPFGLRNIDTHDQGIIALVNDGKCQYCGGRRATRYLSLVTDVFSVDLEKVSASHGWAN